MRPEIVKRAKKFIALTSVLLVLLPALLAADNSTQHTDFISTLSTYKGKEFRRILKRELREYVRLYPDAANVAQKHLELAALFDKDKDTDASFFTYMEIAYLYPDSKARATALEHLRSIMVKEKAYSRLQDQIEPMLTAKVEGLSREMACHAFLRDMVGLRLDRQRDLLLQATTRFMQDYPSSADNDHVLYWHAGLLADSGEPRQALAEYLKLTYLHDSSVLVTSSKLAIASLFAEKLKDYPKATATLEEFLVEYPDDPQAAVAQFDMARIQERRQKKYVEALTSYTEVAKKYPSSPEAVPALFEAARMYEDRFKEYEQSIRIYTQIVRDFPQDIKAPAAMAEAARIYEKRLKDYSNAASVYYKVYGLYPQDPLAPQALYKAADLAENKLKDNAMAAEYYRALVQQYPSHKLAGKADKRLGKLSEDVAAK